MTEQQRVAAAKLALRLKRASTDLAEFIPMVVRDDHGTPLELAPIHQQWVNHVRYCWERQLNAIVLAPFGHGKSSTLAIPLIAHVLGRDPNTRIKVVTNDDGSATKRVAAVKRILESPIYRAIFPEVRRGGKWTDHELYLERTGHAIDPSVHARGVFTTGIGGRADLIIFDDVCDQKNSSDATQRDKVFDFLEGTWLSRKEPDARVLYIGTVWHINDATHRFMQRPGWCSLIDRINEDKSMHDFELVGAIDNAYPAVGQAQAWRAA